MVLFRPPNPVSAWGVLGIVLGLVLSIGSAQEGEGDTVTEIPSRFFQTQDSNGYFWQAAGNGALTSGDTQYLQSGLNWIVDGIAFNPSKATVRSPDVFPSDAGMTLEEARDSLVLKRDLWVDRERGGVRALDTISNRGGSSVSLEVILRTTYPFAWQSLHGIDGELLSKDPILTLDRDDVGIAAHFSAAEGRHDTFFIVAGEGDALRPKLQASSNRRELSFVYEMVIPAGSSRSLLHWISQKALPELPMAPEVFSQFFLRGQLLTPNLDEGEEKALVNFPPEAIPDSSESQGGRDALLSLNSILDPLGILRLSEDVHWINSSSRISGTIGGSDTLTLQANHLGEMSLKRSELAAIRGGAGSGRKSVFYLRNGEVRVGSLLEGELTLTPSGADSASPIDFETMNLLLFRTASTDGKPPAATTHFLSMMDGTSLAIQEASQTSLLLSTPWGSQEVTLDSLKELSHVSAPYPSHRILTTTGSMLSTFLAQETLPLSLSGGTTVEVSSYLVDQLWEAGANQFSLGNQSDHWLSVEEVPGGSGGGFLLQGNDFLKGELSDFSLLLEDSGAVVTVESATVASISRDLTISPSTGQSLEVLLRNGETLTGSPDASHLLVLWEGRDLRLPFDSILAYVAPEN